MVPFVSGRNNMGMVFKRTLWEQIHNCKEYFCNYDDYNWDWSLQYILMNCFKTEPEVMMLIQRRVFHIGEW